jgi:hypothetical protein
MKPRVEYFSSLNKNEMIEETNSGQSQKRNSDEGKTFYFYQKTSSENSSIDC